MALYPPVNAPLLDARTGLVSREWLAFFRLLSAESGAAVGAITGLTGDVVATGPGVVPAELSDTGVTPGTYGDAANVPQITIDVDGRVTAAAEVAIPPGGDVVGPGVSVDGEIVLFDGATGALIKAATGTGPVKATAGVYGTGAIDLASAEVTGDLPLANLAPAAAASRLLGRGSAAGAGDWEPLTVGAGLALSATELAATAATAASRLWGRGSAAGAGAFQEITLGAGLTMTGTELAASGGGGWIPAVDGAEPPGFLTDGAGVLLLVAGP